MLMFDGHIIQINNSYIPFTIWDLNNDNDNNQMQSLMQLRMSAVTLFFDVIKRPFTDE